MIITSILDLVTFYNGSVPHPTVAELQIPKECSMLSFCTLFWFLNLTQNDIDQENKEYIKDNTMYNKRWNLKITTMAEPRLKIRGHEEAP